MSSKFGGDDSDDEVAEGSELGGATVVKPEERIISKPLQGEQFNTFRTEKRKRCDTSDSESEELEGSGGKAGMTARSATQATKRRPDFDKDVTSSRARKRVRHESTDDDDPSDSDGSLLVESVKKRACEDIRDLGNQK